MKRLELAASIHTPYVVFDPHEKVFLIEGKSFPEDSKHFYQSILDWLIEYKNQKPSSFVLTINLVYLSSSSIISVKQLLLIMTDYQKEGISVEIHWHYDEDDDDIKKTGEDYMRITNLNFIFKVNHIN